MVVVGTLIWAAILAVVPIFLFQDVLAAEESLFPFYFLFAASALAGCLAVALLVKELLQIFRRRSKGSK